MIKMYMWCYELQPSLRPKARGIAVGMLRKIVKVMDNHSSRSGRNSKHVFPEEKTREQRRWNWAILKLCPLKQ